MVDYLEEVHKAMEKESCKDTIDTITDNFFNMEIEQESGFFLSVFNTFQTQYHFEFAWRQQSPLTLDLFKYIRSYKSEVHLQEQIWGMYNTICVQILCTNLSCVKLDLFEKVFI